MTFPISDATPIRFSAPLPKACEVVVLGGGIMGVMTVWYLAEAGVRVVLCEKGRVAGEQSSRNWGWIRQQGRDLAELPIMVESMRLWKGLSSEFGAGLGFRQEGVMYLARTEAEMAGFEDWRKQAMVHQLDTVMQTPDQIKAQGGNSSLIHIDWMIGSDKVDIDGLRADGTKVPVMRKGEWA